MGAIGGSIESVTLDGRTFAVAGDVEVQRKLGGFENEVTANGDGTGRLIKTRVPFSLDGLQVETDDAAGDQEFLQELADRQVFFPITVTFVSGSIYQGNGQISGEMQTSSQNASTALNIAGTGVMTKQS